MKLNLFPSPKPIAALALIALASLIALALLADARSARAQTQGPTFTFPSDMPQARQDAYRNYFAALSAFSQTRFDASPNTDDLTITIHADDETCGVGQGINSITLYAGCLDQSGHSVSWSISSFIGELYFHILWDSWYFTEIPDWTNDWMVEGAARYFAYIWVAHHHEDQTYNNLRSFHIQSVSEFDPAPLSQINPFDPAGRSLAFLAIDYLAEQTGATKPIDYFTAARNSSPAGFEEHFQSVFGISLDAFYDYFAAHHAAGFPQPGALIAGGQIDNRISEIERQTGMLQQLIQGMQALIQALTTRVDALDGGTAPVATPTAIADAHNASAHTPPPTTDTPTPEPALNPALSRRPPSLEVPEYLILGPAPSNISASRTVKRTEKVLAALIDFPDVTDAERRFTKVDIDNLLNDNPDSLKKFIYETSRQLVTVDFDVLDWVTINKTRSQYGGAAAYDLVADAVSALSSRSDLSQYDKVVLFVVPLETGYPGCIAYLEPIAYHTPDGVFDLGTAVLSGYDMACVRKGRIAHEFGHTYGFLHSYQITCQKQPAIPRNLIDVTDKNDSCFEMYCVHWDDCSETFPDDSPIIANGDFDMMGGDHASRYEEHFPVHFHAVWQAMAGWLPEEQILIASQAGEYILTNLEALTSNAKAIKIPVGADHKGETQWYWLETRTFTPACEVSIRQQASEISPDVGSWDTFNYGWVVRPDQPFLDPHRGIRIEMLGCTQGADEETVRLKIDFTRLTADKPLVALFNHGETSVNLTNNSNTLVQIGAVSIGGRHPTNFIINSDECSGRALNQGMSCAIDVWHIQENPMGGDNRYAHDVKHGVLKIPNSDALATDLAIALFGNQAKRGTVLPTHTPTPTPIGTPTQTPTATPPPTPTYTPTPVPIDNRLTELERQTGMLQQLIQNLQALIQALTNRLDAIDGGAAQPTLTPTPTATPSPTPTSVPGTDPTPVIASACIQRIELAALIAGTTIAGTWTTKCLTANPDPTGTYYAKFYTFTLDGSEELEIRITSDETPYIYLMADEGTDGEVVHYGQIPQGDMTQPILNPGNYTLEVTTNSSGVTGDFNLWMGLRR